MSIKYFFGGYFSEGGKKMENENGPNMEPCGAEMNRWKLLSSRPLSCFRDVPLDAQFKEEFTFCLKKENTIKTRTLIIFQGISLEKKHLHCCSV